ncbi:MAG TPA: GDYXXLXY domain-containing protein [Thermoanaerobaculia bacterium]|jgi:hypothetical protein|nr:GDYXXLXY domain-containing protein [Thermoanaerobaculia bacterium]
MNARTKILILALVQAGTMLAWAGYHERLWQTAPTFRLALAPVDPHDVLRGRYFILNPQGATIATANLNASPLSTAAFQAFLGPAPANYYHGPVQVGFCPAGAVRKICALARPDAVRPAIPGVLWASGSIVLWRNRGPDMKLNFSGDIDLGLDRFFLPDKARLPGPENAAGWELEVVHREGQLLLPKRLWFGGKPVEF